MWWVGSIYTAKAIRASLFLSSDLTKWGIIGDKLTMANKQKQQNQTTHITPAQAKVVEEREKRLAEALRENLKRRKTTSKTTSKTTDK